MRTLCLGEVWRVSTDRVEKLASYLRRPVSLDAPLGEEKASRGELRRRTDVSIPVLSGRYTEDEAVMALVSGANDYVMLRGHHRELGCPSRARRAQGVGGRLMGGSCDGGKGPRWSPRC